jgi:hypothetical protein
MLDACSVEFTSLLHVCYVVKLILTFQARLRDLY